MYALTINFNSAEELATAANLLSGNAASVGSQLSAASAANIGSVVVPPEEVAAKRARKASKSAESEPATAPKSAAEVLEANVKKDAEISATVSTEEAISYDEVKAITLKVNKDKGRDAAVKLLSDFGAKNATEIKKERYAEYLQTAQSILDEETLA